MAMCYHVLIGEVKGNIDGRVSPSLRPTFFFSLRTTSVIYGYSLNRKMYLNMISRGLYMCIRDDHQDIVIESNADEDVTTYQEHLASYMNVMLQRIRNVLKVT